jgi:hypothetical protein
MKRRASMQIIPEKDLDTDYEDPYSTEPEDYTPSKRIIYKLKGVLKPKSAAELPKSDSKPLMEESSSFLSLLNSLKSSEYHNETEEFLKELNSEEIITPTKITPIVQTQYKLLHQTEAKLKVNNISKGTGTIEINLAVGFKLALIVFRNSIKTIMFTGSLLHSLQSKTLEKPSKTPGKERTRIEISLIQHPEKIKAVCVISLSTPLINNFQNALEKAIEYINIE